MAQIIVTFSAVQTEAKVIDKIDEIAKREKRTRSYIIMEALKEYNKAHGAGNKSYALEVFENGAVAFPTVWAALGKDELKAYSWKEEDEMLKRLEKAVAAIKTDRQAKRDEEMRGKGLNPRR